MLKVEIINSGSAFDGEGRGRELARILRSLAYDLDEIGVQCGMWTLHDVNGNKCGTVDLLAAETEPDQ